MEYAQRRASQRRAWQKWNIRFLLPLVIGLLGIWPVQPSRAQDFAAPAFAARWARTDRPIQTGAVVRTWLWGPSPFTPALYERYREAPGGVRLVQYFDKGRMELTYPNSDPTAPWYVTGGLLTRELISGRIQVGDSTFFDTGSGATVPIAGDPDTPFPTYADFAALVDHTQPKRTGLAATAALTPSGLTQYTDAAQDPNAQFVQYITYRGPSGQTVGYNIPRAFWTFMTQSGVAEQDGQLVTASPLFDWLFVLGYPIADPVWAQVRLRGEPTWVLIQPFERRVLTYTPTNPAGWQVEMGNVGQHYYRWRYQFTPPTTLAPGAAYYGLQPGSRWTYTTTAGTQEKWETLDPSVSFIAGSAFIPRKETAPQGTRVTYWAITNRGVFFTGYDRLDQNGTVTETTMFWPALRFLSVLDLSEGVQWTVTATALSTDAPPRPASLHVEVQENELVSTTYGLVPAWRLRVTMQGVLPENATSPQTLTIWFSPGIGIVQWTSDALAVQLVSFQPGD
ncbi:MAG: hypothetical protein IRY86_00185 [Thermorudis peleae]|nr:hypothetical protein [Thermorudis peleae]